MQSIFYIATAALAASIAYAQDGSGEGANNSTVPTAQEGNRTIHYVDVALGGHYYIPNSIQAEIGDTVTFRFYPRNHSVIRAEYGFPCIPYEDVVSGGRGFDSGFFESDKIAGEPGTWNLTVNSTEPIFYYCGAPGSCNDWGMVGVINANGTQDIARQISLAKEADYVILPGEPFPEEAIASMSSMVASATTATLTAAPTSSDTAAAATADANSSQSQPSSGLSGGAIAGIVIGAVAGLAILAALFFLLGRTKNMKNKLDEREKQDRTASTFGPPSWQAPNGQYFNPNTPHASAQLPPYGHPDHGFYEQKPADETMSLTGGPMSPPLRAQSPPMGQGQHPMPGFQGMQPDQRNSQQGANYGYASVSELSGGTPMAAELYTPGKDGTSPDGHPAYNK